MARPAHTQRNQRLETRITAAQKELIERAASVQGQTVTDFVVSALQQAAQKTIEQSTVWSLSQEQQQTFLDALANPPAPNETLRGARKRYEAYKRSAGRGR